MSSNCTCKFTCNEFLTHEADHTVTLKDIGQVYRQLIEAANCSSDIFNYRGILRMVAMVDSHYNVI